MTYNQPSGDIESSKGDLDFTRRLAELSEIAQIHHIDHLIVTTIRETSKSYCSIREMTKNFFNSGRDKR